MPILYKALRSVPISTCKVRGLTRRSREIIYEPSSSDAILPAVFGNCRHNRQIAGNHLAISDLRDNFKTGCPIWQIVIGWHLFLIYVQILNSMVPNVQRTP